LQPDGELDLSFQLQFAGEITNYIWFPGLHVLTFRPFTNAHVAVAFWMFGAEGFIGGYWGIFDQGGSPVLFTNTAAVNQSLVRAMAVQPDGRLLVAGYHEPFLPECRRSSPDCTGRVRGCDVPATRDHQLECGRSHRRPTRRQDRHVARSSPIQDVPDGPRAAWIAS